MATKSKRTSKKTSKQVDRRTVIAQKMGRGTNEIQTVALQLEALKQEGILIDLNISGVNMFLRTARWEDYGVAPTDEDGRHATMRKGQKYVTPEEKVRELKSVEVRMRQVFAKYTRRISGFSPFHWLSWTAYDEFTDKWKELKEEFDSVVTQIVADYPTYVEIMTERYHKLAINAWDSLTNQSTYQWVIASNGKALDRDAFIDYTVNDALSKMPTLKRIQTELKADYVVAMVYTDYDFAADAAKADIERTKVRAAAQRETLKTQAMQEQTRYKMWSNQAKQQEREIKMQAIFAAEMEHHRQQLQETMSPFMEVFLATRNEFAKDAKEILDSIRKNGVLRGKVAERGRNLIKLYEVMTTHDDAELHKLLVTLKNELGLKGKSQDEQDVSTIQKVLGEITALADEMKETLLDTNADFMDAIEIE